MPPVVTEQPSLKAASLPCYHTDVKCSSLERRKILIEPVAFASNGLSVGHYSLLSSEIELHRVFGGKSFLRSLVHMFDFLAASSEVSLASDLLWVLNACQSSAFYTQSAAPRLLCSYA